jgi:uncharacterized protein
MKLLLLAFILLIHTANAQFVNESEASIKAVAVTSAEQEGVVVDIAVTITPGNGRVFISISPYTEIDMQGSAQLAALTACDVLGIDFMKYNFFYTIEANAPIVGGPSAGGVIAIATIAALKNLSIKSNVFMTGMIYPDGFIGPVGSIPQKLQAAAENGAKIFLIPKGQRVVYVTELIEERRGPFILISTRTKPIDVVEYGEQLGVKVREVGTVEDALVYYTGFSIAKPQPHFNLSEYSDILNRLAVRMKEDTLSLLGELGELKDYAQELGAVAEKIRSANESYERGDYYTATSQYFTAKIELRYIVYTHTIKNDEDLSNEFEIVENELKSTVSYLKSVENLGVESFQLFGAAEERVTIADEYLQKAKTSKSFDDALQALAYSKERIESAKVWLSLLNAIKKDIPIGKDELKKRAQFYLNQAESLIVYAMAVGGYKSLIEEAETSAHLSREQLDKELYSGAALSAMDAITKASLSIELINADQELIKSKEETARDSAQTALSEVERVVIPILPTAYYEYAETAENIVLKLSYYKLSERLAKLISVVAKAYPERELVEVQFVPQESPIPKKTKMPAEEIPGFELALATVATAVAVYCRIRR